jgi:iron complex outermembrane receptor protein
MKLRLKPSAAAVALVLTTCTVSSNAFADNHEVVTVTGQRLFTELQSPLDNTNSVSVDLSEVLDKLAGVDINNNGPATNILQYRGMFGERVNVMIDGATITGAGPNAMDSPLSHILAEPGLTVSAARGIAPVIAGPETLGGHIVIQSNEQLFFSKQDRFFGHLLGQTLDNGDMYQGGGSLGYSTDSAYGLVMLTEQRADEMEDGSGRQIPNFRYDRSGGKAKFGAKFDDHQVHFSYQRLDTDNAGTPALGMDINYIDAEWYRLKYLFEPNDDFGVSVTLFGNDNKHGMDNISQRNTMDMMARLNTVDAESNGIDALAYLETELGRLDFGFNWVDDEHNSVITNPVMNNLTINNFNGISRELASVFAQLSEQQDHWRWAAGMRFANVASDAGEVGSTMAMMNPNVATLVNDFNGSDRSIDHNLFDLTLHADYSFNRNLTGILAIAQKTRAPSYTELYTWLPLTISAGLADGFTYLGNLDLDEETAHQIDLGLNWQHDNWSLMSNIYYQSIDDYIVGVPAMNQAAMMITTMMGNSAPLQWQNVDATIWGAEFTGQYKLSSELTLSMTANLVRGKRDDIDDNLFRMSPNSLRTALTWQRENITLNAESVLFARQERVSLLQNEQESAGYGLINLSASYQFSPNLTASLNANNLLDKTYQPHLAGVNRIRDAETPVGERLFAPGRQIMASLQYRFGI